MKSFAHMKTGTMLFLVLCIPLGCVTCVAVAWGATFMPAWSPQSGGYWEGMKSGVNGLRIARGLDFFGDLGINSSEQPPPAPRWVDWLSRSPSGDLRGTRGIAAGWPERCVYAMEGVSSPQGAVGAPRTRVGIGFLHIPPRLGQHQHRAWNRNAVPVAPLWPGLVLNTLFYASIWFLLFPAFGPAMLRRRLRNRRGDPCPRCGYDLCALPGPVCPECGHAIWIVKID